MIARNGSPGNLKPGEKRDVVVQFGRDFYALTIKAEGYEEVHTPLGTS